jgi:hypothetical protein
VWLYLDLETAQQQQPLPKMAPRRPSKRSKVTDTRTRNVSSLDAANIVADIPVVPAVIDVSTTSPIDDDDCSACTYEISPDIHAALNVFGASKMQAERTRAMERLSSLTKSSRTNVQDLFDANGVTVVLNAIFHWSRSRVMILYALDVLVNVTNYLSVAKGDDTFLSLHLLPIVIDNLKIDLDVLTRAAQLYRNLAQHHHKDSETMARLCGPKIVNFLTDLMKEHPYDTDVMEPCCSYFEMMSRVPELKNVLLEQGAVQCLKNGCNNYLNVDYSDNEDESFVQQHCNIR